MSKKLESPMLALKQDKNLSAPGRTHYLDGWRGMAIAAVLIGHFCSIVPELANLGVELFFVLSGRLMAQILVDKQIALPTFFARRFTRIYPVMFVFVLVFFAFGQVFERFTSAYKFPTFVDVLTAWTFTINYKVVFFGDSPGFDHLWSICVEEHSYILLALIVFLCRRNPRSIAIVVAVFTVAALANGLRLNILMPDDLRSVYWRSDVRLSSIFMSFLVYVVSRRYLRISSWFVLPAFLVGSALFLSGAPFPLMFSLGTFLLALSVNLIDAVPERIRQALSARWITYLGVFSYSMYIWQQPFFRGTAKFNGLPLLVAAAVCGISSYYLLETPAREFLNGRWKRFRDSRNSSP